MIQCSNCHTELVTESLASGRDIRCAQCGCLIAGELLGGSNKFSNRDAWWSLGLGISSIFLACFAGIPAIYLGIRALLRMKYRPATVAARRAAIWGIFSGGLFGVLMGGTLIAFAAIILIFRGMTEITSDPERSMEVLNEIALLDLDYERIQPTRAVHSRVLMSVVSLMDSPKQKDRRVIVKLMRFPTWMATNRAQFRNMLRDEYLDSSRKYHRDDDEMLTWKINGSDVTVNKIVSRFEKPGSDAEAAVRIMQYYFLKDIGNYTFGFVLIHQPPDSELSETGIQRIFESFQIVE